MIRASYSRRAVSVIALLACLTMGLSACSGLAKPGTAASIDGATVSVSLLDDLVDGLVRFNPQLEQSFNGPGDSTLNTLSANTVLSYLVLRKLGTEIASDRGLKISSEDRDKGKQQFLGRLAQDPETQQKVLESLEPEHADMLIESEAAAFALQADLGKSEDQDGAAKEIFDADPTQFESSCISALTVESEAAMKSVQDRLANNEDFAAIAKDVSIDDTASKGGDLGCIPASQLGQVADQIAAAEVGAVIGPFGQPAADGQPGQFVLIRLDDRQNADFETVKADIIAGLPPAGQQALSDLLGKAESSAEIDVNPRYGRWDSETQQVVPPEGPLQATPDSAAG